MNKQIRETAVTAIAVIMLAIGINVFGWQYKLLSGGFPGYGFFVNYLTDFSPGMFIFIANIVVLLLALLLVGKGPGVRAIVGFIFVSLMVDTTRNLLNLSAVDTVTLQQKIFYTILMSISTAVTVNIIIANNFSVGSYTTIYIIVKKYFDITPQQLFIVLDAILVLLSWIFLDLTTALLLALFAVLFFLISQVVFPPLKKYFNPPVPEVNE